MRSSFSVSVVVHVSSAGPFRRISLKWWAHVSIDIVRAVIGLFNHMGTLKPDIDDWIDVFNAGLSKYRSMRSSTESEKHKHSVRTC